MKERFEKHAQHLTDGERELLWRQISAGNQQESRRRRQFWTTLSASGAVVTAAIAFAIMLSGESPEQLTERVPLQPAPRSERATPRVEEAEAPMASEAHVADETLAESAAPAPKRAKKEVAAPAAPEKDPTVASPRADRRVAAADPLGKGGDRESLALDADATGELTVLALSEEAFDSTESWVKTEPLGRLARIYGRVTDSASGKPLAYANVVLAGTNFGAMTLEDGSFTIMAPPGLYDLVVTYMGYEAVQISDLSAGEGILDTERFAMDHSVALELETVLIEGQKPAVDVKSSSVRTRGDRDELKAFEVGKRPEAMALEAGGIAKQSRVGAGREQGVSSSIKSVYGAPIPTTVAERQSDDLGGYPAARRRGCWIPPDWREPNGEPFDAMYFRDYGTNPFVVTEEDALSTFAVDVDAASYTVMRRYLDEGSLPPEAAIRVEEFVNFFDAGYGRMRGGDFALRVDGAPSPFGEGYHLLRLGVQARDIPRRERKPANLIFVIDTSGSMDRENRLGLVKRALHILLDELEDSDTVGIVEYGSRGREILRPTSLEDRRQIERAIESLHPNGSTNAEEGLDLGYTMASRNYDEQTINRIILCSDGVANTGETQAERILDRVRYESDRGIHLSAVGFGMGNYNDVLMEKLANQGDGNYHYVDRIAEAERVFRENLTGTLQTVARDAKIQVEFDPEQVLRWRLLGYENRDVADEDFRDDAVDAGEIGAGHTVVALYELKLSDETRRAVAGQSRGDSRDPQRFGSFRLRYEYPAGHERAGEVVELDQTLHSSQFSRAFERAKPGLRQAALAAEFAEILRGSYWARGSSLAILADEAERLVDELRDDAAAREFRRLVERATRLRERQGGR